MVKQQNLKILITSTSSAVIQKKIVKNDEILKLKGTLDLCENYKIRYAHINQLRFTENATNKTTSTAIDAIGLFTRLWKEKKCLNYDKFLQC